MIQLSKSFISHSYLTAGLQCFADFYHLGLSIYLPILHSFGVCLFVCLFFPKKPTLLTMGWGKPYRNSTGDSSFLFSRPEMAISFFFFFFFSWLHFWTISYMYRRHSICTAEISAASLHYYLRAIVFFWLIESNILLIYSGSRQISVSSRQT